MPSPASLEHLLLLFQKAGASAVFAKEMAANDNSKNQIYLGGDWEALQIFPTEHISGEPDSKGDWRCHAPLDFHWLREDGKSFDAPGAQLILYPQYPEVRLSGVLAGAEWSPRDLIVSREEGRILFFGVHPEGKVFGHIVDRDSAIAKDFGALEGLEKAGVLVRIPAEHPGLFGDSIETLVEDLKRVRRKGWILSKRLGTAGETLPCNHSACGGYTLEAELGVIPNGISQPDYLGWEIKQFGVDHFDRVSSTRVTLMSPQPTGGLYAESGVFAFLKRFGYPAEGSDGNRLNFNGLHRVGQTHSKTTLKMELAGYDLEKNKIEDLSQGIRLLAGDGSIAAEWSYLSLLKHWMDKHSRAAYLPSQVEREPIRKYRYGPSALLCRRTDFSLFLEALATGKIYYDPSIKIEDAKSENPRAKHRSPFRIRSGDLPSLYHSAVWTDIS